MDNELIDINNKTIKVIKNLRLLDAISWPVEVEHQFLENIAKNKRKKIEIKYPKKDYKEKKEGLSKLLKKLSKDDPLHLYTSQTIESYLNAIEMIESAGTKKFQELSVKQYGIPGHNLFGSDYSHLSTAENFLEAFHEYDHPYVEEEVQYLTPKDLKNFLLKEAPKVLGDSSPVVKITKDIFAKATASKSAIKIRKDARFTMIDIKNLLIHEVFTHSLTGINGTFQQQLPLLAYGAPRTTKTQEGLATFSEVITGLMDLDRLKRISLRVIAIDMALNGANLYELYDFFRSKDQSEKESFLSASRILRGGTPKGGIVFTKDGVYLEGLIRVHSLFRWAFKKEHLDLIHLLFAGRMDVNDVFLFRAPYKNGLIADPKYLPDWYQNSNLLAGKMAFSLILNGISLKKVEDHFENKFIEN